MNLLRSTLIAAISFNLVSLTPALAGAGHDHGVVDSAAQATPPSPRFEAANEAYEVVGRVKGNVLTLYLDEWATNAPLDDVTLAMMIGQRQVALQKTAPGVFTASLKEATKQGSYPITLTLNRNGTPALLAAQLVVVEPQAGQGLAATPPSLKTALGGAGLLLVLVGGALFVMRRRRAAITAGGLALVFGAAGLTLQPEPAFASGDHDHGEAAAAAGISSDQASRLANGDINAPKPMQHLIGLRTIVAQSSTVGAAMTLNGLVIADPNGMGVVQAQIGGRISGQLPALGQTVSQGQGLARVTPAFDATGRASLVESQGQIAQDLALARQRAARLAGGGATEVDAELAAARARANGGATAEARAELAAARQRLERLQRLEGVVPTRDIEAARAQVRGIEARVAAQQGEANATLRALDARRATLVAEARGEAAALSARAGALRETGNPNETLRAPISGTISAVNVAQGQVVAPGETLFSIIRPGSLLVEAKATDAASAQLSEMASGRTADGRTVSLVRQGIGLALVDGGLPIRYRVELDAGLRAGEPVTVFANSAIPTTGIAVPRIAVARGANGQSVVFVKQSGETITPVTVVVSDLDAQRVLVTSGLSPGQRIVVAGSPLLAQVR
jgi:membrane fusion protein, heavy metal efflux system